MVKKVETIQDCPPVSRKLVKHLKAVFSNRINYSPSDPMLGQWAAYQGAFLKMLEYLEKANLLQTRGPEVFATHELRHNGRAKEDQFNANLEGLRSSIRNGTAFEIGS